MLNSSLDILYIVLAFCVLWVSIFLCWMLFYVVTVLRNVNFFMEEIRSKAEMMNKALVGVKDRLEHSVSHLGVIGDAAKNFVKMTIEKKMKEKQKEE